LLVIDLLAITLLMHSSGGVTNGLGYLILVAVAAGGILLRGQIAIFFAAMACIAVISETLYRFFYATLNNNALFSAASLGVLVFIIAIAFQYLTKKILTSTQEAQEQAQHVAHLQNLAQQIVERMRTGILVFNKDHEIELLNKSAMNLLALATDESRKLLLSDIPVLENKVQQWKKSNSAHSPIVITDKSLTDEVKVNFTQLAPGEAADTLVFVEDNRAITQQAQQLKLASLGRLTASIAHEIRNPLGAISHASQLLGEAEMLAPDDQRLLDIINAHCKRVNQIIENVLQLSRRRATQPQQVQLNAWLKDFVQDYQNSKSHSININLHCLAVDITGQFDPGQ
jgi:two-component system sensor histidine kinase PilS (NtrC family)